MKNKKTPGQVVVIITIFIAVIILLSIVLINLGKVSDIKTTTSQIADSGTLNLASQWATYCNSLRDTLKRKADAASLLGTGLGCIVDSDVRIACINWGLIIPLAAVFLAIVLIPFFLPISLGLVMLVANPLWTEINTIMKSGFQVAAANMTQYSAMRETSIAAMMANTMMDTEMADRLSGDMFVYQYGCLQINPLPAACTPQYYYYNLADTPMAPVLKGQDHVSRYVAWYWSDRHPKVTEAGLGPEIEALINSLVEITEFNHWDDNTWLYTEVSLKVDDPNITCGAQSDGSDGGACPDWAVKEKDITRIIAHVTAKEPTNIWQWLMNLVFGASPYQGFFPVKFEQLTKRLLATHYASQIHYTIPEIDRVTESLRGVMLRVMELLNLPVAHRIPAINNWLPVWYNPDRPTDPDTIYGMLFDILEGNGQIRGVKVWLEDLRAIEADTSVVIPSDNGYHNHYGIGAQVSDCETEMCCRYCDSDCCCWECYCNTQGCSFQGNYCSACGGADIPLCWNRDLYSAEPTYGCGLENRWPGCCEDCYENPGCPDACQFEGALIPWGSGPDEILQAIRILESFQKAIEDVMDAIATFAVRAHAIMYPTDSGIIQLQKEEIYGWVDKNENLNVAQVLLDNYPSRDVFPYIKEGYEWGGLWKYWTIVGQVNGSIGDVTVSRYTSDVSVGPWWTFRYRRNPSQAEWPRDELGGIIHNIHLTGAPGGAAAGLETYGITSQTKGHYGMHKDQIYIQREK